MATETPGLANFPPTRRKILLFLKREPDAAAEAIASAAEITVSGARQHLVALERDGLVDHLEQREGAGRPKYLYRLSAAGDARFPRYYATLTNELLQYVQDEDAELLAHIFDRRGQRRLAAATQRLAGRSFPEQVAELACILDEDGYLASCTALPDGTYRIVEHNCAVLSVAQRYGHACRSELDFIRAALPAAEVTRIAHIIAGNHVCAYAIRPRDSDSPDAASAPG